MEKSVTAVSIEVSFLIESLQTSLNALVERYQSELEHFAFNPDDQSQYTYVSKEIEKYYPDFFAFTVTDSDGSPFYDDFGERVGELCRSDIRRFAQDNRLSTYIHPGPSEYHFDIMLPWAYGNQQKGVFFASFKLRMFARVLKTSEVPGHQLMLVRSDIDDLIEVTAQGGRPDLTRDFQLSQDERRRVTHQKRVPLTKWTLVDLPDETLFTTHSRQTHYEAIATFAGFALISVLMLFLIMRKEKQRVLAERALRESRDELESANQRIAEWNENLQAHMQDLHDDVGAKLLTLSHRCKNPLNSETARSALADLRLTIHDLGRQRTAVPLAHVLADLRAEMQERMEAAKIDLQWSQSHQLSESDYILDFRQRFNLIRILREALSNAIRHAQPTTLRVEVAIDNDILRVSLCNDGSVEGVTDWTPGTGMRNMRRRAEELDGTIEWSQSPTRNGTGPRETCVHVGCPLLNKA